jgi:hypothetical protein
MIKPAPHNHSAVLNNNAGILAGPLIFSAFVGLFLVVVLYPFIMKLEFSSRLRHGLEGTILIVVLAITILAYQSAKAVKIRKFVKGAEAPLLVRNLMDSCLKGDIGCLKKLLAEHEESDIHVLVTLLQAKAESILQSELAHLTDIHKKIGLRLFNKKCNLSYHLFVRSPDEYAQASLPKEIVLMRRAISKEQPASLSRKLDALESSRQTMFTLLSDYLIIVPEQNSNLRFLRKTYKYRPPVLEIARKMTFCLDIYDGVDRLKDEDFKSPLMGQIKAAAQDRIPLLRAAVKRYESDWESIVEIYENQYYY